jgi:hypothetical protein
MSLLPFETGQSLGTIAAEQLGDVSKWRELASANGIKLFDQILPQQPIKIPPPEEVEAWALTQSRNAINDLKGTATNSQLYKDVDRITGGELSKFVDSQLKTVDGAIEKFVKGEIGDRLRTFAKGETYNGLTKVLDWLYD